MARNFPLDVNEWKNHDLNPDPAYKMQHLYQFSYAHEDASLYIIKIYVKFIF
jgi:hypothetical protein